MLNKLKLLLDIERADLDEKLKLLISNAESRLALLLGGVDEVPEDLEYIVQEVAVIRFNRIGSEGLKSHTVEGESMTFTDNDFEGFKGDIQAWLDSQEDAKRGKVRFI